MDDRHRKTWTTRVNLKPSAEERIKKIAQEEKLSIATKIGTLIEDYVTSRSTA